MITIFNRKELISTYDIKRQAEVRDILAQNNIDYDIKTSNRTSSALIPPDQRAYTGSFGENLSLEYEYTIYVKKEDYETACYLIRQNHQS